MASPNLKEQPLTFYVLGSLVTFNPLSKKIFWNEELLSFEEFRLRHPMAAEFLKNYFKFAE
jgi:hypothetical protein